MKYAAVDIGCFKLWLWSIQYIKATEHKDPTKSRLQ